MSNMSLLCNCTLTCVVFKYAMAFVFIWKHLELYFVVSFYLIPVLSMITLLKLRFQWLRSNLPLSVTICHNIHRCVVGSCIMSCTKSCIKDSEDVMCTSTSLLKEERKKKLKTICNTP